MIRLNSTKDAEWARLNSQEEVYSILLDNAGENRKKQTTLGFETFNRYEFKNEPQLCDKLRLYDTVPLSLVTGREPPSICKCASPISNPLAC